MSLFTVHSISPSVEVRVTREPPPLPANVDAHIDAIWSRVAARVEANGAPLLFNGRIFSIDSITPGRIAGHMTEYRRLMAQIEDNSLFAELGVRALAVCGLLRCADGIVFGRRFASATYQAGLWQPCPAGSVDENTRRDDGTVDYRAQLQIETREELGLGAEALGDITPLCVVEHAGSHICDLGMSFSTLLGAASIKAAHRDSGNGEYDALRIVPIDALSDFVAWAGASLVPQARPLLSRARLLPVDR